MAENHTAATSGDVRAALEALRDTLAADLDICGPNVRAQIAAQYRATLSDIAVLAPAEGGPVSKLDELRGRRERNHGTAPVGASAAPVAVGTGTAGRKRGA